MGLGLGLFRLIMSIWVIDHHYQWSVHYIEAWFVEHFGREHFGYLGIGHVAVMCFFVLSGYVITWVLNNKYPLNAVGIKAFLVGRFIRIYPLYWTILLIILAVMVAVMGWHPDHIPQMEPERILGDLLLIPYGFIGFFHFLNKYAYGMIDVPAWTLPYDFVFYLMAPWVVPHRRVLAAIIGFELLYLAVLAGFGPQVFMGSGDAVGHGWHEAYFTSGHSAILAFCIGALGYYYRQVNIPRPVLIGAMLALLYLTFAPYGLTNYYVNHLLVMGVALVLVLGLKKRSKLDNLLGELTYSTYLLHVPLLESLAWLGLSFASVVALPLTYLLSFLTVKFFEAPLEARRAAITRRMLADVPADAPAALPGARWVLGALAALLIVSGLHNLSRLAF